MCRCRERGGGGGAGAPHRGAAEPATAAYIPPPGAAHPSRAAEFADFGETMSRPHRGSKPVSGGLRAAEKSSRCLHTPPTTGDPHASRIFICMPFGLTTSSEAPCGARWPSRHPFCRSGACIHNWTPREPVYLQQGKRTCQCSELARAPWPQLTYLPTSLALRSDGVLHLVGG